jgi:hypothetical protein
MSAKHTPGPWGILSAAVGPACMAFSIGQLNEEKGLDGVSDEYAVCVVPLIHDESRPNAALIAAAPDLLEALECIADALSPPRNAEEEEAIAAALAAIAKAKGEV